MSLEKVAEQMALAEPSSTHCLTSRPLRPDTRVVELTERLDQPGNAARATELALSLGLSAAAVNRAQLDALAWAEGMGR